MRLDLLWGDLGLFLSSSSVVIIQSLFFPFLFSFTMSAKPSRSAKLPSAQPPEKLTGLKLKAPASQAAGLGAVASSFKHILSRAGLVQGMSGMLGMNQKGGFDCPSCAWPDPDDHRAQFEFCENGAKALASETTRERVTPEFFAKHSVQWLAEQSDLWLDKAGRITEPVVLRPGAEHYVRISWGEAYEMIAAELHGLDSPDEAIFYTSGRASNEAAFLYQLFVRQYGTNNLPDCSNMCHESSGAAMNACVGVGKGTVSLQDLHEAETILVIGQNPGTNHPRMLSALQESVRNGGKVIAVNPLQEAGLMGFAHPQEVGGMMGLGTPLASTFLRVRQNGDMALIMGLSRTLLEDGTVDHEFLKTHTSGSEDYMAHILRQDWNELVRMCGIAKEAIQKVARQAASGQRKVVTCWAMGLTQHHNAVATIQEVCHFHLLLGAIGRPGAGLCPVRGHSNVQGDRTMGVFEKMPEWFMARLSEVCEFQAPRHHGLDTVDSIRAMYDGRARVFYALGGNFLQATPDTEYTAEALRRCRLTVQVSTKLNRSHLVTGKAALILPCYGRSEEDIIDGFPQYVTVENSMGVVQASTGRMVPASRHLKGEPTIIAETAAAVLKGRSGLDWQGMANDYHRIRALIERVVPGFANFHERVAEPGGFYLPNSARELKWDTPAERATFFVNAVSQFAPAAGRLILQTFRSHDQFNTTIYGLNDRYRGIGNERRVIFMNPGDMKAAGVKPLQPVDITSHWTDGERVARGFLAVPYEISQGSCAAYYPEANVLVPITSYAAVSQTPTSKCVEVSVVPALG